MRDGFHYKFWVYILSSRSGRRYVGLTGFFDRRIMRHKMETLKGSWGREMRFRGERLG